VKATVWDWPALDLEGQAQQRLTVEWAVWGKVHGAASDFRWIAHSPGIDPQARRLELELLLGTEDAPERATFWRALGGSFCAVSCYPSRALDAARRSGFLEKQLLEWKPPAGAPAALGALLLLPQVARFTDEEWWEHSADPGWSRPDFALVLEPEAAAPVEVSENDLRSNVEAGLGDLRDAVGEESVLAELYSALLTGRRPAILAGLRRPLTPQGITALLLPLPREVADRLSVAGWLLSKRVDAEGFRRLWDVLVCDRPPDALLSSPPVEITEEGRQAARAVFAEDPSRLLRPPRPAVARAPADRLQLPSAVERLQDFATDPSRRWLAPEELAGGPDRLLRAAEACDGYLVDCVESVESEIQSLNGTSGLVRWQREHLQVKADLLRAAALALAPVTFRRLGLPKSGRVPALLFCTRLDERDKGRLEGLGEDKLGELARQSLGCRPDLFGREIRKRMAWLVPLFDRLSSR
jgi:hypothetical protein